MQVRPAQQRPKTGREVSADPTPSAPSLSLRMDLLGVDTGGGGEAKTAKRKAPSTSEAVDLTAPEEEVDGNNNEKKKKKKEEVVVVLDD